MSSASQANYSVIKRPSCRSSLFYITTGLYYVHLPLLFLAIHLWIAPPIWMYDIVAFNQGQRASSTTIPGVGQVFCCLASPSDAPQWFVEGSSSCDSEDYTIGSGQPYTLQSDYKPYFPCELNPSAIGQDNSRCTDSAFPIAASYDCGLQTVPSIKPLVDLARLILAAVLFKEVLKLITYLLLHRRYDALLNSPDGGALLHQVKGRMVWFSRSLLMIPFCFWFGPSELRLRHELENEVSGGKVKVMVIDLLLQDMLHLAFTALIFVVTESVSVLNTRQTQLNLASFALSAVVITINLFDCLRALCCPFFRSERRADDGGVLPIDGVQRTRLQHYP